MPKLLIVPTANMEPYRLTNTIITRSRALENHITVCYCNWGEFTTKEGVQLNGHSSITNYLGNPVVNFKTGEHGGPKQLFTLESRELIGLSTIFGFHVCK